MKICFPVETDNGLQSHVYGHFGSAPGFVVFDTESNDVEYINNKDASHEHGSCSPASALTGKEVDAVVVGGIGQGALMKLAMSGISVFRSKDRVILKDIESLAKSELEVLSLDMKTCSHGTHSCGGH